MLNKKSAFTLAEILIALTIIGVVAALTVPRVMTNTNAKTNIVKTKKAYATIANALQIGESKLDYNIEDVTAFTGNSYTVQSFLTDTMDAKLVSSGENSSYAFNGKLLEITADKPTFATSTTTSGIEKKATVFKMRDGAYIIFPDKNDTTSSSTGPTGATIANGCAKDFPCIGYIDINGPKGPNELITCTEGSDTAWTQENSPEPCTVAESAITDIYPFVIYGASINTATGSFEAILSME